MNLLCRIDNSHRRIGQTALIQCLSQLILRDVMHSDEGLLILQRELGFHVNNISKRLACKHRDSISLFLGDELHHLGRLHDALVLEFCLNTIADLPESGLVVQLAKLLHGIIQVVVSAKQILHLILAVNLFYIQVFWSMEPFIPFLAFDSLKLHGMQLVSVSIHIGRFLALGRSKTIDVVTYLL